jgi:hypothetical protein
MAKFITFTKLKANGTTVTMRRFFNIWGWPWTQWDHAQDRMHAKQNEISAAARKLEALVDDLTELYAQENDRLVDINDRDSEQMQGEGPRRFVTMKLFARKPPRVSKPADDLWEDYYQFCSSEGGGPGPGTIIRGTVMTPSASTFNAPQAQAVAVDGEIIGTVNHRLTPQSNRQQRKQKGQGGQQNNQQN